MTLTEKITDLILTNEYAKNIGLEFESLNVGSGRGKIKLKNDILNPYGSVHGGCLYSLADIVSGCVACTYGKYVTTLCGSLNFMRAAINTEYVYCDANTLRAGRNIIVVEVKLTNDRNELVDSGEFTFFVTEKAIEL